MTREPEAGPLRTLNQLGDSNDSVSRGRFGLSGLLIFTNVSGLALALLLSTEDPLTTLVGSLILSGFLSPLITLLYIAFFPVRDKSRRYAKKNEVKTE